MRAWRAFGIWPDAVEEKEWWGKGGNMAFKFCFSVKRLTPDIPILSALSDILSPSSASVCWGWGAKQ